LQGGTYRHAEDSNLFILRSHFVDWSKKDPLTDGMEWRLGKGRTEERWKSREQRAESRNGLRLGEFMGEREKKIAANLAENSF